MQCQYIRPAWAEIDLDNLAYNIRQIRSFIGPDVKMMAVVKSDAYGTGIPGVLDTFLEHGVEMFGVAILDEALLIREKGVRMPILVFAYTPFEYSDLLVEYDISQTVYCKEQAAAISAAASRLKKKGRIHLEIDTGMGRLGFLPSNESVKTIKEIAEMPNLELEGIYTHLPLSNERNPDGISFTEHQYREFCLLANKLEAEGLNIALKHLCNSLGTLYYRKMHLDLIRAGIILYGSYPHFQNVLPLRPVISLKTRIGSIKRLGAGKNVSYGRQYVTGRETTIATLPIGYGDGYSRMLSNRGWVLVNGRRAPVIGSICMDQSMIDVTDIQEECRIGDEVVLWGRQGEGEIAIEGISKAACGFINYEYMVNLSRRVPRVYKKGGEVVQVLGGLLNA